MKFYSATVLSTLVGASQFALAAAPSAPKTDAAYNCQNASGAFELALKADSGASETVYGEMFGDEPKGLLAVESDDFSIKVGPDEYLEQIQDVGDGDTQFEFLILHEEAVDHPAALKVTTVFDNQREQDPKKEFSYSTFNCTRK